MPSDLQITNIRDQANANSAITIGSDGQITVNQNNPTLTLGSNTTFPTGKLINSIFFQVDTGASRSTNSTTIEAAYNYISVPCTIGNTLFCGFNFYAYVSNNGTSNTYQRYARWRLYQSTAGTRPAEGATSSLGTEIWQSVIGRGLVGASTSSTPVYVPVMASASFMATATTHHLGLGMNAEAGGTAVTSYIVQPVTFFAMEFQGDVQTEGAVP